MLFSRFRESPGRLRKGRPDGPLSRPGAAQWSIGLIALLLIALLRAGVHSNNTGTRRRWRPRKGRPDGPLSRPGAAQWSIGLIALLLIALLRAGVHSNNTGPRRRWRPART